MLLLPGTAVTAAPAFVTQLPVSPLGVATTRPPGSVSMKLILSSCVLLFGLVTVNVRAVDPPCGMLPTPNALARLGGCTAALGVTSKMAGLLVAPGPLSVAPIGPVVLFFVPTLVACTFT